LTHITTTLRAVRSSHLALILLLAAPATADAQRTIDRSRHLWATVNICDTELSPDTIGLRASMPGSGRRTERMYMRFRVQFKGPDEAWHDFTPPGVHSEFIPVGSARFKARQSGWSFPFDLSEGQRIELRGVVNYEWRRGRRVVRRATKSTTPGHNVTVADPEGYSAATCSLTG
jgi:hypothetical protein